MADTTNGGRKFWGDLSRKTGTWAAVGGLAVIAAEQAEAWLTSSQFEPGQPHHWIAVIAAAVIRAIVGLVQGKVGDPSSASFAPAKSTDAPDAPAPPLSDPPVGDPDQL